MRKYRSFLDGFADGVKIDALLPFFVGSDTEGMGQQQT